MTGWKTFLMQNSGLPVEKRDWSGLLSEMKAMAVPVPAPVGKIISHRDAVGELERVIVRDMKNGTFFRVSGFLSDVFPRPWIGGNEMQAGIAPDEVDQSWYAYCPETGRIRHLTGDDWNMCIAAADGIW